jgi:flavin-binding protein dodecin
MSVYKVIELVGTSTKSWEDAANEAIEMAKKSLRELRIAEVVKMDVRLDDGDIVEYRVRMNVSFKYED